MLSQVSDDSPEPSNLINKGEAQSQAAERHIFLLLRQHAAAWQKMSMYDCAGTVSEVDMFSLEMQRTPWAFSLIGRAYYEMVDYQKAWDVRKKRITHSFVFDRLRLRSRKSVAWILID
jgi:anaphase-promoting complex subunit 3